MTRHLRPEEEDVLRAALRQAGVDPTDRSIRGAGRSGHSTTEGHEGGSRRCDDPTCRCNTTDEHGGALILAGLSLIAGFVLLVWTLKGGA